MTRDPLSEWFDAGARQLLSRAYAHPGEWVTTRLAGPTAEHRSRARAMLPPIDLDEPDPVPGAKAKTRWGRAFLRALYYQHRWWSAPGGGWRTTKRTTLRKSGALLVEFGPRQRALGVIPAGMRVAVQLAPGGAEKARAVAALPHSQRWNVASHPGPASSDLEDREWQAAPVT